MFLDGVGGDVPRARAANEPGELAAVAPAVLEEIIFGGCFWVVVEVFI
jgi:hypothetical protein